jgi:hypothetical protein
MEINYNSLFHVIKDMNSRDIIKIEREDNMAEIEALSLEKEEKFKKLRKQIEDDENRELLNKFMSGEFF